MTTLGERRAAHMHGDTLVKQTLDFISTVKFILSYLDMDNHFQNPHSVKVN